MRAVGAALLAATLGLSCACDEISDAGPAVTVEVKPLPAFRQPVFTTVMSGDTLESVCRRLAGDDWVVWRDALTSEIEPRRLQPGVTFDGRCASGGQLQELKVRLDMRRELLLEQTGGQITAQRLERPIELTTIHLSGTIQSSLFSAIEVAGGRPELAVRMAEIFQWDIDFLRDLRQGDSFEAVVDRQTVGGDHYGYGTIFAVRFCNRGKELHAVAYRDSSGRLGYYDLEGRPMRKQFLRSPLKFSRITSRFSLRRYHPVHKRTMPHYGVDYGAPVGTPVRVTADGSVTFVGRNGGAGKIVKVRHANGFETNYLHLSRYGRGIRKGVRVSQGQVIGYVGSTGWSTGAHLDYRVKQNGRWLNPLTISSPPVKPLDEQNRQQYLAYAEEVLKLLDNGQDSQGGQPDAGRFRAHLQELAPTSPVAEAG